MIIREHFHKYSSIVDLLILISIPKGLEIFGFKMPDSSSKSKTFVVTKLLLTNADLKFLVSL